MMTEEAPPDTGRQKERQRPASPFLDIEEAAERLKLSPHTLNKWRHEGRGPAFRDHGRRIVYHVDDLDSWSQDHKRHKARSYGGNKPDASEPDGGEQ
tara:strand:- start:1344 stop:1634 length:291 start_codon:yes stop_codon:yes gene_type:complete